MVLAQQSFGGSNHLELMPYDGSLRLQCQPITSRAPVAQLSDI